MIFLLLLLIVVAFVALPWGVYAAFRAVIAGRGSPGMVLILMAFGLTFLALLGHNDWLVGLDAFACADNAELVMEAIPGSAAGGRGEPVKWEFYNCAIHWYDRPGVRG